MDNLCRLGIHSRRIVRWVECGTRTTADGTRSYSEIMHGYRCVRCEPTPGHPVFRQNTCTTCRHMTTSGRGPIE